MDSLKDNEMLALVEQFSASLNLLRKVAEGTLYGHLLEPYFWMNLAVISECPRLLQQGKAIAESHEPEMIDGMLATAKFYLKNLPQDSIAYQQAQYFYQLCSEYIKEHSGVFVPKPPPWLAQ